LKKTISFDPGTSGAGAIAYNDDLKYIELFNLQEIGHTIDLLHDLADESLDGEITVVCENPPPFAGKNIPSSAGFKLGKSFGEIVGAVRALKIPLYLVSPKEWQKGLSGLAKLSGQPRKRVLADHAKRFFPNTKITIRNADAALILKFFINNNPK
jgi:hypothetical protein